MKKLLLMVTALNLLIACSKDQIEEIEIAPTANTHDALTTRAVNATSWDQCDCCITCNNDTVALPWAATSTGSIPADVRKDVKKNDGWEFLYSTVNIVGYNHTINNYHNANYILLYNRYLGVLKGFYYAAEMQPNNNAFWELIVPEKDTKLFNFSSYFAVPANKSLTNTVTISNVSTNGATHGFDRGWNCFMLELAYDENSINETLDVKGFCLNEVTYDFSGSFNSSSKGTIIVNSSSLPSVFSEMSGAVANAYGDSAKVWITKNMNPTNGPILRSLSTNLVSNLLDNPVKTLISNGLNIVFGSLFGKSANAVQSIQFNTSGDVKLSGTSITPNSGYVMPLMGVPLSGTGHNLGVWNLEEEPTFTLTTVPELVNFMDNGPYLQSWYKVSGISSLKVIRNPAAGTSCLVSHSLTRYDKYDGQSDYDFGNLETGKTRVEMVNSSSVGYTQTKMYDDGNTIISSMPSTYVFRTYGDFPRWKSSDDKPIDYFNNSSYDLRQNVVFKVVAKITFNGPEKAYSCKTFIPKNIKNVHGTSRPYSWTMQELRSLGLVNKYYY